MFQHLCTLNAMAIYLLQDTYYNDLFPVQDATHLRVHKDKVKIQSVGINNMPFDQYLSQMYIAQNKTLHYYQEEIWSLKSSSHYTFLFFNLKT